MMKLYLLAGILLCGFVQRGLAGDSIPVVRSNASYVDPTIGNVGQLLEPTRPTVQLPNQLIRFTPTRKDYMDDQISDFPLTIVSHRLGQVFALKPSVHGSGDQAWDRRLTYDHDLEINRPWYYSTWLVNDNITVEFAPGEKAGIYRFSFPAAGQRALLLNVYNGGGSGWHFLSGKEVEGTESWHGDVKVYMYGVFSVAGKPDEARVLGGLLRMMDEDAAGRPHAPSLARSASSNVVSSGRARPSWARYHSHVWRSPLASVYAGRMPSSVRSLPVVCTAWQS